MTRLIIVRHGYSVANAAKRYTGQMDVALTEEGQRQAVCVADYLTAHEKIDAIYASDLSRAMDTARPTAARMGIDIIPMRALREFSMGIWEGMTHEEVSRDYADVLARRTIDPTYPCPEGESFADVFTRVNGAIDEILAAHEGKTVAVFSHGGAIRCIDCRAAGGTCSKVVGHRGMDNAAITVYRVENGQFTCEMHGFTEHLQQNSSSAPKELL